MGYELNKLLEHYGLNSPTIANYAGSSYSGSAPTTPVLPEAPVAPTLTTLSGNSGLFGSLLPYVTTDNTAKIDDYTAKYNDYNAKKDAYNTQKAEYDKYQQYLADKKSYDDYVNDYKNRIKNTSMYGQGANTKMTMPAYQAYQSTLQNAQDITAPTNLTYAPSESVTPTTTTSVTPSSGLLGGVIDNAVNAGVLAPVTTTTTAPTITNVPMVNNTLTNASSTLFQGPTPLFSGIWGSSPYSSFGGWGMGRAKGGSIDTAAEKNKLAKKYGFGGTVEGNSVDPITLNYYNPQPDPMAEIPMVISAGQGKAPTSGLDELDYFYNQDPYTSEQESDDYPNQADMLSSKAQVPAMYQLNESGQPVISEQPVAPQVPDQPDLGQLSAKYSEMSPYAAQIAESRKIAKAESDAFTKMIQGQLTSPEQNNLSKAEMYFRLAAAFGSPTRTKQGFMENLGAAGQQLAEYSKGARSDEAAKNALRLEAQKLRMQTAKEDLTTLRTLAAEEMKDKRALDLELLKEKIKADQPLSAEGKAAYDIGLRKGTPEFSQKVEDFVNAKNEARAAGVLVQQGNLDVNRAKLAKENKDLSSTELQLKQQTESLINSSSDALNMVERALKLNDEARITSGVSGIKHTVLSYVNADDPTTKATNELLNLLKSKTYSNLKATFGGQLSDGERKALEGVSGSEAKSPEERKRILINAAAALRNARERSKKQLDAISSGSYGEKIEKTK